MTSQTHDLSTTFHLSLLKHPKCPFWILLSEVLLFRKTWVYLYDLVCISDLNNISFSIPLIIVSVFSVLIITKFPLTQPSGSWPTSDQHRFSEFQSLWVKHLRFSLILPHNDHYHTFRHHRFSPSVDRRHFSQLGQLSCFLFLDQLDSRSPLP